MDMLDSDYVECDFGDVVTRNIGVEFCCILLPQSIDLTCFLFSFLFCCCVFCNPGWLMSVFFPSNGW